MLLPLMYFRTRVLYGRSLFLRACYMWGSVQVCPLASECLGLRVGFNLLLYTDFRLFTHATSILLVHVVANGRMNMNNS